MKKAIFLLVVLLLGMVLAISNDWSGFQVDNTDNTSSSVNTVPTPSTTAITTTQLNNAQNNIPSNNVANQQNQANSTTNASTRNGWSNVALLNEDTNYNTNFYYAVGVVVLGLLLAILFSYLFFKKPKDHWNTTT